MQSNIKDKKDCQADFLVIIQSSNLVLELCIDKTLFEIFEINLGGLYNILTYYFAMNNSAT